MSRRIDSRSFSNSQNSLLKTSAILNQDTDEELECHGYEKSACKGFLFGCLVVLTLGLILLVIFWKPELQCYLRYQQCNLYKATVVLLRTRYGFSAVVPVRRMTEPIDGDVGGNYTDGNAAREETTDDRAQLSASWIANKDDGLHYFDNQNTRYIWDQAKHTFRKLEDLSVKTRCIAFHDQYHGLSDAQRQARLRLYTDNQMDIEVPSYGALFIGEVLNPFYIFQIASIILWSLDDYYYYASCILLISCISIGISLRETKRQRVTLRDMVATEEGTIQVCTNAQEFKEIPEKDLVPGDVIVIPPNGCVMTCDAVLIAGTCIVNESMLTGESVPVTKTTLQQQDDDEIYSSENHKRHTLFSGTHVVQTRYYGQAKVLAVVTRTGFNTAKGELVRAILFPKPLDFEFYRDAIRFILFLGGVASLGMVYSLITYIRYGEPTETTILRVLDIITIVVPPALPAAMTVGTVYAQSRLKKGGIFCISPPRINFCGRINVFCFDKTGTLTEDGLDMGGVVPVINSRFQPHVTDASTLARAPLLVSMATCHSITIIDGELCGDPLDLIMFNGIKWHLEEPGTDTHKYDTIMPTVVKPYSPDTFLGEEEEFRMLQIEHPFEVGIIRQFTFSSSLQRMSVITRTMGEDHMDIFAKGAPEKIASLCKPETVPEDFHSVLHSYSVQGFRVIALAHRTMESKVTWHQVQRISRDKIEKDLTFLGLLIMQNQLKPQTAPVIRTLKEADIRTVMVTGDMLQTAVSVARNCCMVGKRDTVIILNGHPPDKEAPARIEFEEAERAVVASTSEAETEIDGEYESQNEPLIKGNSAPPDSRKSKGKRYASVHMDEIVQGKHLAINGKSFSVVSTYFPDLLPKICVQGTVFARMSPDQKCQLIEQLQKLDYIVGMCGDGANDCEALKAAHAGISLSEAEASVAAPFTSRVGNIECVVTAMREGRAALVTSFGCFKYMALYSFIQFTSVLILYTCMTNLSDFEFLHIDLVITTSIAILLGNSGAYHKLVRKKPPGSLMKASNLLSIVFQVLLVGGFQLAGYFYLTTQDFYKESSNETLTAYNHSNPPLFESTGNVVTEKELSTRTWESSFIFLISSFMYVSVAFTFSKGPPYRKPIYTNVLFLLDIIVLYAISIFLLLKPLSPIMDFLVMKPLQDTPFFFRLKILALVVGFVISSSILDWLVVDSGMFSCFYKAIKLCRNAKQRRYKTLKKEIESADWPAVFEISMSASHHFPEPPKDTIVDVH